MCESSRTAAANCSGPTWADKALQACSGMQHPIQDIAELRERSLRLERLESLVVKLCEDIVKVPLPILANSRLCAVATLVAPTLLRRQSETALVGESEWLAKLTPYVARSA